MDQKPLDLSKTSTYSVTESQHLDTKTKQEIRKKHEDNLGIFDNSGCDERSTASCDFPRPSTSTGPCCNIYTSTTGKSIKVKTVTDSVDIKLKPIKPSSNERKQVEERIADSERDERSVVSCNCFGPSTSTGAICDFHSSTTGKAVEVKNKTVTDSGDIKPKYFDSSSDGELQFQSIIVDNLDCVAKSTAICGCSEPSTNTGECCNFHYSKYRKRVTKGKKKAHYACRYCSYVSTHKTNFVAHERTHTGEKPFECQHCKTMFRTRNQVKMHVLHLHTENGPFPCKECAGVFATKYDLNQHETTHFETRPYKCSKCPKAFNARSSLFYHDIWHSGEKPHKCAICLIAFEYKCNLKHHKCTRKNPKK